MNEQQTVTWRQVTDAHLVECSLCGAVLCGVYGGIETHTRWHAGQREATTEEDDR